MTKLTKYLTILFGFSVVVLYWFDWNLCEKNNPSFDLKFWNNYVVFCGYLFFTYAFFKHLQSPSSSNIGAVSSAIVYGILIGAYKSEGSVCGTLGEGMGKYYYYNTETYLPFLLNNIALGLYAVFSFFSKSNEVGKESEVPPASNLTESSKADNSVQTDEFITLEQDKESHTSVKIQTSIENVKSFSKEILMQFYLENSNELLSPEEVIEISNKVFTLSDFSGFNKDKTIELCRSGEILFGFPEGILISSSQFYVFDNGFKSKYFIFPLGDFCRVSGNPKTAFSYGRLRVNDVVIKKQGGEKFKFHLYGKLIELLNKSNEV